MKKLIFLVAAALLSATAFCAEHTLGLGITFPVSSLNFKDSDDEFDEDITQTGVGVDLTYLFISDSGFTGKADFAFEKISASDFEENPDEGLNCVFDFGIGYTFLRDEKFSLSALGMFGFSLGAYNWYDDPVTESLLMKTLDFGVDVVGKFKFTNHLGAFANLGLRYSIDAGSKYEVEFRASAHEEDFDIGLKTQGFRFIPTLGVSWTF